MNKTTNLTMNLTTNEETNKETNYNMKGNHLTSKGSFSWVTLDDFEHCFGGVSD